MRNFKRKKVWGNIAESKPFLIFLSLIVVFFAWNVLGLFGKMSETARNKKSAEAKVTTLEAQKEKLEQDIGELKTEEGKERVFRENYGLAKEGEDMIVVVDDINNNSPEAQPAGGIFSFLFFWKNWFK